MTRIPGTIWMPATYDSMYPLGKAFPRSLDGIWFTVNHDARGFSPFLANGQAPGREAMWLISNLVDGTRLQHAELEAATWTSGGHWNNLHGVATEHENLQGPWGLPTFDVLTPAQVEADLETELFLATVCPNLRPPVFGQGRREHSELTNGTTTCPSGRIQPLYDSNEEGFMAGLNDDEQRELYEWVKDIDEEAQSLRHRVATIAGLLNEDGKKRSGDDDTLALTAAQALILDKLDAIKTKLDSHDHH